MISSLYDQFRSPLLILAGLASSLSLTLAQDGGKTVTVEEVLSDNSEASVSAEAGANDAINEPEALPEPPDPIQALRDREARIKAVHERVSPSIVALGSVDPQFQGWGSGVIVNETGLILTAGHVTEATGEDILVYLADGRQMVAKRLGANMNRDAAMAQLIPVNESETFPYVEIAEIDSTELGDWVVALGHPGGYDATRPAPLRAGRVIQKQSDKLIVTDCTLAGGDSGGAVFDLDGRLVGINSSIAQSVSHNIHITMSVFDRAWDRMLDGETWGELVNLFDEPLPGYESKVKRKERRAVLGARFDTRTGSKNGVLVRAVSPGLPAADAGLRRGDVVVGFDGKSVTDYSDDFKPLLDAMDPGDEVEIIVRRRGQDVTLNAVMGDRAKLIKDARR